MDIAAPNRSAIPQKRNLEVQLGPLRLSSPAVLAPLAGYTDSAMRRLCRRFGAAMVFSEMLSAEGTRRNNAKTLRMAAFHDDERPYAIQLFATSPEQAAEAADVLCDLRPDALDLNFGCPVRRIVADCGGSALLRDVPLLARIVAATVKAVRIPVSVKMRAGWDRRSLNAVDVARAVEDSGAAWVTVHARTRCEFHQGPAHWEWIGEVKSAVRLPVIGNGDVRTAADAARLMNTTGCDAVMIGRAAMGNPFIFREVNHLIAHGQPCPPPTPMERFAAAQQQLLWMVEQWGEHRAMLDFRKQLIACVKGLPRNLAFRLEAMKLERVSVLIEALRDYLASLPDVPTARPLPVAGELPRQE